ncbi:SRPBCC family protein [Knoellia sinensis]|nr:SRPBCC family protein [Knoellia sinensis]
MRESPLPPERLWQRLAAIPDHTQAVPLTTTLSGPGSPSNGWAFTVRTALGPFHFDDTMTVESWDPPRLWRVRKTGRLEGWAEAVVHPYAGGSRVTWTEELWLGVPGLRRVTTRIGDRVGPWLFGRVLDRIVGVPS